MKRRFAILQGGAVTRKATAFLKRLAGRKARPRILQWKRER